MNAVITIIVNFIKKHWKTIAKILILCGLSAWCILATKKCSNYKNEAEQNIVAMNDTVKYWKAKNGQTIAEKTLVIGKYKDLKLINDSLYQQTKLMKLKNPTVVIGGTTTVELPVHDTIYNDIPATTSPINKSFDFSDKWRILTGHVNYHDSIMNVGIDKNSVDFKYALAIQNNKVYMTSDNPYVKFSKTTGLTIPSYQQKKKKFGVGPVIFGGYDFGNSKFGFGVGIGISYNLLQW